MITGPIAGLSLERTAEYGFVIGQTYPITGVEEDLETPSVSGGCFYKLNKGDGSSPWWFYHKDVTNPYVTTDNILAGYGIE